MMRQNSINSSENRYLLEPIKSMFEAYDPAMVFSAIRCKSI